MTNKFKKNEDNLKHINRILNEYNIHASMFYDMFVTRYHLYQNFKKIGTIGISEQNIILSINFHKDIIIKIGRNKKLDEILKNK